VNEHKVRGSASQTLDMLLYCLEKDGRVDIVASWGDRPRGSLYLVAKSSAAGQAAAASHAAASTNTNNDGNNAAAQSTPQDAFLETGNVIDGLELEETKEGNSRVRIVASSNTSSGFFSGLRLNKGDCIYTIDGVPIKSIDDARGALMDAVAVKNHVMIPILTYNVFRRLKTIVMGTAMSSMLSKQQAAGQAGKPVSIEDMYNVHDKLGEGAFAVVKKATHKSTGNPYAIKIVNRSSLNKDMEFALKDEISILKELNHEHIMRLENVVVTINHYYLVAEYLEGGELFDRIVDKSSYTESEARDVCRILFGALSYIHSKGIVHRDLKPENLLLQNKDSDSEIKIADFGFAKEASNGDHSLKTMCGTPGYVAPEILRREKYGTKVDMWSMGVIVFILLGGYPPFYADSPRQLCLLSKVGKFEFDPEYWGGISMGAKDMICSLLVTDPAKRASAEDILSHPWMREDTYKLKCMSLSKTQVELKKYIARMRFKKAIHSVSSFVLLFHYCFPPIGAHNMITNIFSLLIHKINQILFVNTFTGQNAIFSGTNKRKAIKTLEDLGVFC